MNKPFLSFLIGSMLISNTGIYAQTTGLAALPIYAKAGAKHLFSADGAKDMVATYGVMMLVTLIHELGHAAVAKAMCGVPMDVVIGGKRREGSPWKFAGVELAGFNPLQSDARWEEFHEKDKGIYQPTPSQRKAMLLAGPLMQAVAGYCIYKSLKNHDKFPLAKLAAVGAIADTIIGINGLYGAMNVPWSDPFKFLKK